MKQTLFCIVLISMLFAAYSFSAGAEKDFKTGLTCTYKGCTVTDVKLVDAQQMPFTSDEV